MDRLQKLSAHFVDLSFGKINIMFDALKSKQIIDLYVNSLFLAFDLHGPGQWILCHMPEFLRHPIDFRRKLPVSHRFQKQFQLSGCQRDLSYFHC